MANEQLQHIFPGLDMDAFWDAEQADIAHGDGHPSNQLIASVEAELGYRLPTSYVALMRTRNGGMPRTPAVRHRACARFRQLLRSTACRERLRLRLSAYLGLP